MPTVEVPRILRYQLGDQAAAMVEGGTLGEALANLYEAYPLLARHVTDGGGRLRSYIVLALNGEVIGGRPDLARPVAVDDRVVFLQAVSGG